MFALDLFIQGACFTLFRLLKDETSTFYSYSRVERLWPVVSALHVI